jgi:hypothetical protein
MSFRIKYNEILYCFGGSIGETKSNIMMNSFLLWKWSSQGEKGPLCIHIIILYEQVTMSRAESEKKSKHCKAQIESPKPSSYNYK